MGWTIQPVMLPDVDTESWAGFQADEFSSSVDRRIDSLGFSTAADQRISDLSRIGSWATPAAQPQNEPPVAPEPTPAPPPPETPPAPEPVAAGPSAPSALLDLNQPAPVVPDAPLPSPGRTTPLPPTSAATGPAAAATGDPNLIAQALQAADAAGVDRNLYVQLIRQESSFNPNARSPVGAAGLSQLMPDTARGLGVTNPYDVGQSLRAGAQYLKQQIDHFGGDVIKGLAAYNAGAGNVEKYGGVPPFAETQKYVDTILGRLAAEQTRNPAGGAAPGPTEGIARAGGALSDSNSARDISQFGDAQLTSEESYAACGPAAAVRFAQAFGRNPTLREATDLAKQVGWTSGQGMAGLGSEKALMDKVGVPTKLINGPQWDQFAREAQTGNPVIISTSGHYFTADGYNADTGAFHVGRSGLDLKGGKEWMTPAQMQSLMGQVQGGLLADNPTVPTPSTADQGSPSWWDNTKNAISSSIGGAVDTAREAIGSVLPKGGTVSPSVQSDVSLVPAPGGGFDPSHMQAVDQPPQPGVPLRQDVRDTGQPNQPTVFDQAGQALGLDEASRAARQAQITQGQQSLQADLQNDPTGLGTAALIGSNVSRIEQRADVQQGEALADTIVSQAKAAGWQPTPDQERIARTTLSQVTPMNVLVSVAGGGEGLTARALVEGLSGLGLSVAGSIGASEAAGGLPPEAQQAAGFVGAVAAPLLGHAAIGRLPGLSSTAEQVAQESRPAVTSAATAAEDAARFPTAPIGNADQYVRIPGGELAPVRTPAGQATSGRDLLQGMLDEANKRGLDPARLAELQAELDRMPAQATVHLATTLGSAAASGAVANANIDPNDPNRWWKVAAAAAAGGAVGYALPGTVGFVRRYAAPALDADPAVQRALNTFDGEVRVAAAQADTLRRQGTLTADAAQQAAQAGADQARTTLRATIGQLPQAVQDAEATRAVLRNVTQGPSDMGRLLGQAARVTGYIKETVLSGSPFHLVFEELQAGRVNPTGAGPAIGRSLLNAADPTGRAYNAWRVRWAPIYESAARAGVTLPESRNMGEAVDLLRGVRGAAIRGVVGGAGAGATTYAADKSAGMDDQAALHDALVKGGMGAIFGGAVGSYMGPALWERAVPTLKVMTWQSLTGRGMGSEAAARVVNQTFGGLNLTRIARSPDVQAVARTIVFAPDVWEGIARQIGHTLNPDIRNPVSNQAKLYAATAALSGAFMLEGLNKAFSGHFTNENDTGHELDLDVTRFTKQTSDTGQPQHVYTDVLGLLKPVAEVGLGLAQGNTDALGKFATGRLSQPLRLAGALGSNQDWRGQPIVDSNATAPQRAVQAVGYAAQQTMPAGASSAGQAYERGGVGGAGIEAATGMRVSSVTESQAARAQGTKNVVGQTISDAGLSYPSTPSSLVVPGSGRGRITLTPDERKTYGTRLYSNLQQQIQAVTSDPSFQTISPSDRKTTVQAAIRAAEQDAAGGILDAIPDTELESRLGQRAKATPTPVIRRR